MLVLEIAGGILLAVVILFAFVAWVDKLANS